MNSNITLVFTNDRALLFIISVIFLSLALPNILLPGLNEDEAVDGFRALHVIKNTLETDGTVSSVNVFDRKLPLMAHSDYIGATETYFLIPFFLLFGPSVFSLRLMPIFISLCTVLFVFSLCREWFGRKLAFFATLLTITSPVFVIYSRTGLYREELFSIFFLWSGLFFCWEYFRKKKGFYLYLGFFLFGLGLSTKIIFLWYVLGLIVASTILRKKIFLSKAINLRDLIVGLSAFFLGTSPLVFHNLKSDGGTLKLMIDSLFLPTRGAGINNLDYINNFIMRVHHFFNILKVEYLDFIVIESRQFLVPILFILSYIAVFILIVSKKKDKSKFYLSKNKVLFIYIFYLTVFLCSPFTVSGLHIGHLFIFFPFPQIIMALFLCILSDIFSKKRGMLFLIYAVFSAVIFFNVRTTLDTNLAIKKTGGSDSWSSTVYELADYLRENSILNPLIFDRHFYYRLPFLTNNEVRPHNLEWHPEGYIIGFEENFLKKDSSYVISMVFDDEKEIGWLEGKVAKYNKRLILKKEFLSRAGDAVYRFYEVR